MLKTNSACNSPMAPKTCQLNIGNKPEINKRTAAKSAKALFFEVDMPTKLGDFQT